MYKSRDVPLQDELLTWTSQPSIHAIQVSHISHVLQKINTARSRGKGQSHI